MTPTAKFLNSVLLPAWVCNRFSNQAANQINTTITCTRNIQCASLLSPAFLHVFPQRKYKTSRYAFVRTPCAQFNRHISPAMPITLVGNHRAETKRIIPITSGNPTLIRCQADQKCFYSTKTDVPVFIRGNTTDSKYFDFRKCHSPVNNTTQDMVLQDTPALRACL